MPDNVDGLLARGASTHNYAVISLNEFANLNLIVLDSEDHGDFVVISAIECGGRRVTAVQGVLRGQVCLIPSPPSAAFQHPTGKNDLRS